MTLSGYKDKKFLNNVVVPLVEKKKKHIYYERLVGLKSLKSDLIFRHTKS